MEPCLWCLESYISVMAKSNCQVIQRSIRFDIRYNMYYILNTMSLTMLRCFIANHYEYFARKLQIVKTNHFNNFYIPKFILGTGFASLISYHFMIMLCNIISCNITSCYIISCLTLALFINFIIMSGFSIHYFSVYCARSC